MSSFSCFLPKLLLATFLLLLLLALFDSRASGSTPFEDHFGESYESKSRILKHCSQTCKGGSCRFENCKNALDCPGGACYFKSCERPACKGEEHDAISIICLFLSFCVYKFIIDNNFV
jgi:hypothetical protein